MLDIEQIKNKIHLADCLEFMPNIPDKSIDCIICDLPYGTTCLKWDSIIDFNLLWAEYKRIIRKDGVIVLFAIQPFTTKLVASNMDMFHYIWTWKKDTPTGFLNANYAPLKATEDICIFSHGKVGSLSKNPIRYFPQGVKEVNKSKVNNPNSNWRKNKGYPSTGNKLNSNESYVQKYTGYPSNILEFARDKDAIHPTQKPVKLLEYLIKTYTKEGEVVLDNCSGSGSLAVAAYNTRRNFICIEKNEEYYNKSVERLERVRNQLSLF